MYADEIREEDAGGRGIGFTRSDDLGAGRQVRATILRTDDWRSSSSRNSIAGCTNTGIATDCARVARSVNRGALDGEGRAGGCSPAAPMPELQVP